MTNRIWVCSYCEFVRRLSDLDDFDACPRCGSEMLQDDELDEDLENLD